MLVLGALTSFSLVCATPFAGTFTLARTFGFSAVGLELFVTLGRGFATTFSVERVFIIFRGLTTYITSNRS